MFVVGFIVFSIFRTLGDLNFLNTRYEIMWIESISIIKFISKISAKKGGKKKFSNIGGFGSISDIPKNIKNIGIIVLFHTYEDYLGHLKQHN